MSPEAAAALADVVKVLLILMLGVGGGAIVRIRRGNRLVRNDDVDLFERVKALAAEQMDVQRRWTIDQVQSARQDAAIKIDELRDELTRSNRAHNATRSRLDRTQRRMVAYELRVYQLQTAMQAADPPIPVPPWIDREHDELDDQLDAQELRDRQPQPSEEERR